jgi:hypothetical protein
MNSLEISPLDSPIVSNEDVYNLHNLSPSTKEDAQGTYDQINQLFNTKDQQEKSILEAREILGESAKDLTDNQVYDLLNEIQFLVDSWLEEYERNTFEGKTLDELIGLKT